MSTTKKNIALVIARTLLGLVYVVFGFNYFFHFITGPMPEGKAAAFIGGLFQSGYFFPMMKVIEIALGLLLLINLFAPLALVVLMPITLNIFLYHSILVPSGFIMAAVMMILHLFIAWKYRSYYKPLFVQKAVAV